MEHQAQMSVPSHPGGLNMEVEMGNGNVREDEAMDEDLEEKMERIHAEENGEVVAVEPQAPEEMEDQGWKINGMSVEELEALEQLEEAEEELRRWRAKKNKMKNVKKQTVSIKTCYIIKCVRYYIKF